MTIYFTKYFVVFLIQHMGTGDRQQRGCRASRNASRAPALRAAIAFGFAHSNGTSVRRAPQRTIHTTTCSGCGDAGPQAAAGAVGRWQNVQEVRVRVRVRGAVPSGWRPFLTGHQHRTAGARRSHWGLSTGHAPRHTTTRTRCGCTRLWRVQAPQTRDLASRGREGGEADCTEAAQQSVPRRVDTERWRRGAEADNRARTGTWADRPPGIRVSECSGALRRLAPQFQGPSAGGVRNWLTVSRSGHLTATQSTPGCLHRP